jgi:hypothetical protein
VKYVAVVTRGITRVRVRVRVHHLLVECKEWNT